jgi:hypothetical protein
MRNGRMLILATPAGLDEFFLEAGRDADPSKPGAGVATEADIERLIGVAPKYGIEVKLPSKV